MDVRGAKEHCGKLAVSRKKKRPLPPRTLRMDCRGRLQSARPWLATQRDRPAERIARSYRKRYGVDWKCAIQELTALGIVFAPKWQEQLEQTLESEYRAKAMRREEQKAPSAGWELTESDENFAFIAGYTKGGAPFGITRDEWEKIERSDPSTPIERPLQNDAPEQCDDESPPF